MRGITHILDADGDKIHGIHYAPLTLEFIRVAVGGFAEQVPHFTTYMDTPCVAFCNEDGKAKDLPVNKEVTMLWRQQLPNSDVLRGTVLIVSGDQQFMREL